MASWMKSTHTYQPFLVTGCSLRWLSCRLERTCFLLPGQPTTVPCFPSEASSALQLESISHCLVASSQLRAQAGPELSGRKLCYLRRDGPLFQQGEGGLGHEKQTKSSQGWTAEREVHFHSLHFIEMPTGTHDCRANKYILQNNMCAVLTHSITGSL